MLLSNDRVRPPFRPEVQHRDNQLQEANEARAGQRRWTRRNRGPASSSPQQDSTELDRGAEAVLPLCEVLGGPLRCAAGGDNGWPGGRPMG